MSLNLSAEQIESLPVDELALGVLQSAPGEWAVRNWFLLPRPGSPSYQTEPLLTRLSRAWEWLFTNGLVARDYTQNEATAFKITREGHELIESGDLSAIRAAARLSLDLHPELESKVRPQFLRGDFEMAVFAAMRAVEVRVRTMGGFDSSDIGVALMRRAFGPGGPLCDANLDPGERDARRELFSGAIGTIKNPTSHREVEYENPTEASEAILLADLLMRILDRVPI
jgi:uncharacterized protein (TIGR02391 family)